MTQAVHCEQRGAILIIRLDRPKANAIDTHTSQALYQALHDFQHNPELRVAVLTAAGERFFSAGWDLKAAAEGEAVDADHGPGGFAGLTEFFQLDKPVIGAINGMAVGGGFELALACDMLVAVEDAQFFLPEATIGIAPDSGGVFRLPKRLPRALAMEMMMTGRWLSAQEAERHGLVNRVVARDELMTAALELADAVLVSAPLAQQAIKELVNASESLSVAEAFQLQRSGTLAAYGRMLKSDDAQEGSRAFSEGRDPVWQGR